jgi:23S rRNA pseudouridine1911/1915/1917 synthase
MAGSGTSDPTNAPEDDESGGCGERFAATAAAEDAGQRLDRLIAIRLPQLTRSRAKALIEAGHVRTEDVRAEDVEAQDGGKQGGATITEPSYRVKPGQIFAIFVPEPEPALPRPQNIPLDIVYEDADMIVVNKPAGMVVHPAEGNADGTLVNALLAHCGASLSGIGGVRRPGIVHRLDKDTSGLMVVAKNDVAHQALAADLEARRIERVYQALVWGMPSPRDGEIEGNIGRHPVDRKRMAVLKRGGRAALTRYRVLKAAGPAAALLECRLATGRTHQIRVHLASIGHPVVGDPVYSRSTAARLARLGPAARAAVQGFRRQALHAWQLSLRHPRTGETLRWTAEPPADMADLLRELERNAA